MSRRINIPKSKEKRLPKIKPGDKIPNTGYYYVQGGTKIKPVRMKKKQSVGRFKKFSGRR